MRTRGPGYWPCISLIHWEPLTNLFRRPGALIHVAVITGGWLRGGSVRGMTHGGHHCSIPDHPIKTTEKQRVKERGKDVERERDGERKEQWDRQIKDKSLP